MVATEAEGVVTEAAVAATVVVAVEAMMTAVINGTDRIRLAQ